MAEHVNTELDNAIHPGQILNQALKELGISQKELSDAIGKSTPVVNDIIKGKRDISPEIAYLLEAVVDGISAEEWLALQGHYDLSKISKNEELIKRKESIGSWEQLKAVLNISYLKKKIGLIGSVEENVSRIYKYFGVTSIDAIKKISSEATSYFHMSSRHQTDPINLMTWMILVRKKSSTEILDTEFNKSSIESLVKELNDIFYKNEDTSINIHKTLNKYGIKYIEEEHLDKTPVDGYSFWDGKNPTIAVTLRYNRIDNYAFAIMHELGHIALHLTNDKAQNFVDTETPNEEYGKEKEANDFAAISLRGNAPLEDYFRKWINPFSIKGEIIRISDKYKIHKSIITGQFQHYKKSYAICRDLLDSIH